MRKLYKRHYFGGKHTEEKSVLRSIKHLPKEEQKHALQDWKWCKQQGLVVTWLKTYEIHVSLNQRKVKEISELIDLDVSGGSDDEDD